MKQTHRYSFAIIALVALATCGPMGCRQKPSTPDNSFRLTVKHVLDDADVQVMVLHIEACGNRYSQPYYQVSCTNKNGSHSNRSVINRSSPDSDRYQADVKIYAFHISPNGDEKNDYIKTSTGAGYTLRGVPRGTPLNETFSVTVQDGTYPLNAPLVIGREDGADLNLTVGLEGALEATLKRAK